MTLRLTGRLLIPAARRAEILPLLAEHVRLTRAEPGCLAFEVAETPPGSGRLAVSERFADRAAFAAHQARAAASAWGRATTGLPRDYAVEEDGVQDDDVHEDGGPALPAPPAPAS